MDKGYGGNPARDSIESVAETQRDLHADLALCTAVPEVYYDEGGGYTASSLSDAATQFFEEAPVAWPHAIERAISAESEVNRLQMLLSDQEQAIITLRDRALSAGAHCFGLRQEVTYLRVGIAAAMTYPPGIIRAKLSRVLAEAIADE
ncbi:hypothetical protein [Paenibacillus sp. FSL R7-0128]|uniref:hypothetical protein n=1 Tax=Paenibacillus sp. FSL R7-0128 TaxID=2954529 RepID=UPI0030FB03BC